MHWPPAQLTDLVSFIVGIPPDGGGRKPKRGVCADHILDLRDEATKPFHSHLRWIFVITVRRRGFKTLEDVGKERFVKMLNHLHIDINDVWFPGNRQAWSAILLEIIQSVGGLNIWPFSTGNSWQNS